MMRAGPTRTGAAAGHHGYYHEAVCYDSDDQFVATVVPFLAGGVAAGEPTIAVLGEHTADLVRAALPDDAGPVTFLPGDHYARPAATIRSYRRILARHVAGGAGQIRIAGEMPAAMLADVARTHPRTARPDDRHEANATYRDPWSFLSDRRPLPADPLQRGAPRADLSDPAAAAARQVVREAATGILPAEAADDLVIAVSEVVTNAQRHGQPPVRFRLWAGSGRVVVTVSDQGDGPADPFAGLLAANSGGVGGLGLWITHQACDQVALSRDNDGFTVRMTAGNLSTDI